MKKQTLKTTAAVLLAVSCTAGFCGWEYVAPKKQTISRLVTVSNTLYVVTYEYSPEGAVSVPATSPPGQPHHDCTVTVYRAQQVGKPFAGQVTPEGCFEDVPSDMVGKALAQ